MSKMKEKYIQQMESGNMELRIQEFNKGWANGRLELMWELAHPCPHYHSETHGYQKAKRECTICWNNIIENKNE